MIWIILLVVILGIIVTIQYRDIYTKVDISYAELKNNVLVRLNDIDRKVDEKIDSLDNKANLKEKEICKALEQVKDTVHVLEIDRAKKFADVSHHLSTTNSAISEVAKGINILNNALSNTKIRGAFGEKLAEDTIKKIGFVENVHYYKQLKLVNGKIPDFTFILENKLKVNMDSKFPLDNYLKYLSAELDNEKQVYLNKFTKDVKDRIKEFSSRDYINPAENTVDLGIIFIPNDSLLTFISENKYEIIEYAFDNKIILCSPTTLYLVLRVFFEINYMYNLDKNVLKAINSIESFKKELQKYLDEQEKFDNKLDEILKIRNILNTTRFKKLAKTLEQLDELEISS